jgi:hypothetical protein
MTPVTPPRWLRALVHVDFVAAVLLSVLIPLALLVRAILRRREQLPLLLRYWRVSALLMVTVYLLAGRRPHAPAAGIAARLLIAQTLAEPPLVRTQPAASLRHSLASADPLLEHWRRITCAYCLGGAAANLPMLLPHAATLRAAYAEPPTTYANLFHPALAPATLGRIGDAGLAAYAAGALLLTILRKILN